MAAGGGVWGGGDPAGGAVAGASASGGGSHRAAGAAEYSDSGRGTWTKEYFQNTLRDLTATSLHPAGEARRETARRYDLIVWPESPSPFYTNDPLFRDAVSASGAAVGNVGGGGFDRNHARHAQRRGKLADFQLRRAGQSAGRVGWTLRQSASGAVRRIFAVSAAVCVCRRADQRSGRISARPLAYSAGRPQCKVQAGLQPVDLGCSERRQTFWQ